VSGDNWTTGAISRAKLQSNHHHQQTNIQFFSQAGCPSCRPTDSVKALKRKYHIPWTCLPQAHLEVFQLCLRPLISSWLLFTLGRVAMPLISPLMPVSQDKTEKVKLVLPHCKYDNLEGAFKPPQLH